MTRGRFQIARLLLAFGFDRRVKWMREAASELHLRQEGEELLGSHCWEKVEGIEELALEYWQLRKIETARKELEEKIAKAEEVLHETHTARAAMADKARELEASRREELADLEKELKELGEQREEVFTRAQAVRRQYDAQKAKLTVLNKDGDEETETTRQASGKSAELKARFAKLKEERVLIGEKVNEVRGRVDNLRSQLSLNRNESSEETRESFAAISRANRQISQHKAALGTHDQEVARLHRKIGHYLSLNYANSPQCREAVGGHRTLIIQINLLRQSLAFNFRLTENQ